MPHTPPLRLAFIGGALNSAVGYTHFNSSRLDGQFRVESGCFSRDRERNAATANAYGIEPDRVHADWQTLVDTERARIDALVVLTPTPDHFAIVGAALERGIPVICEKALALSSAECRQLDELVARHRGFLAVTYNYSGYPMVRELRQMIAAGELGRLQQIHIEMPQEGFLRTAASPQAWRLRDYGVPTVSLDLGVHVHHLVHFLTGGQTPLSVIGDQAALGCFGGIVDNVYGLAHYADDLRVQTWYGKTALGYRNGLRIRVFGERAGAEWLQTDPEDLHICDADGGRRILDRGASGACIARQPRYNRFKAGHPSGFIEAFANLYVDIAAALRAHLAGDGVGGEFVYGAAPSEEGLRFLEALSASALTRQWQKV